MIEKEGPIHVSNVMLVDPKDERPTRVGVERSGRQARAGHQALQHEDRRLMAARLKERYENEIKPAADQAVRLQEPDAGAAGREDHAQHGRRRGEARTPRCWTPPREQLGVIAGQKPPIRRARKSIANFKLREGMPVGVKVTLRGERMYEMLDRLQSIAIPRIRDFRGLNPRSFDGRGNYSLGIREQIIFPEVDYDSIDQVRGLDVTITTTARDRRGGLRAAAAARHAVPRARTEPTPARGAAPATAGGADAAEEPAAEEPSRRGASRRGSRAAEEPAEEPPAERAGRRGSRETRAEEPAAEERRRGRREPRRPSSRSRRTAHRDQAEE